MDLPADADQAPSFRSPPHNIEAEKALIGAIFVNNRAYEKVSEFLRPEHFALEQHGRIFDACSILVERGQIADPVTLKRYFEQDESLAAVGGPAYLSELATSAVAVINAGEYGRLVYDLHLRRELISLGEDMVNRAYDGNVEDSGPANGVAIDVQGPTEQLTIRDNQISESRGPAERIGIRLGPKTREIRLADNQFKGLAANIVDLRAK